MPSSDIDVCSQALLILGEDSISSFTDGTTRASACGDLYPDLHNFLLTCYNWRFVKEKSDSLGRLAAAPLTRWTYKYQLPSAMLAGPLAVFNSAAANASPINGYEIFHDKELHTHEEAIYIDYLKDIDEANWPGYFAEFAIVATAAKLAMPITSSKSLTDTLRKEAWGDPRNPSDMGAFGLAIGRDAHFEPNKVVEDNSLINARFGG